jgi:hypothetical protein
MAEFGLNNPVLIDPDGGIIADHGRVLAARKLAYSDDPVPSTSPVTGRGSSAQASPASSQRIQSGLIAYLESVGLRPHVHPAAMRFSFDVASSEQTSTQRRRVRNNGRF